MLKQNECSVLGVDACKMGWIVAEIKEETVHVEMYEYFSDVVDAHPCVDLMLIDIPIGLPESIEEVAERPEANVRQMLPKKASSVFTVPCTLAAKQSDYMIANEINKEVLCRGLSKQSYYIMKKAVEVNDYLEKHHEYIEKVLECHPELQFAQLRKTKLPILASKKADIGMKEREALLVDLLFNCLTIKIDIRTISLYRRFPDDVLDAICLALAARLGNEHGFQTIPDNPVHNCKGIPMQMTYFSV